MKSVAVLLIGVLAAIGWIGCSNKSTVLARTNSFSGTVVDGQGNAVPSAMLTVRRVGSGPSTTIFTDRDGRFHVADLKPAEYYVDARHGAFQAQTIDLTVPVKADANIKLVLGTAPHVAVTGADALASIPDSLQKRRFLQNCIMCHSIGMSGTEFAGKSDPEFWLGAMDRMQKLHSAYLSPDFNHKQVAVMLAKYLPAKLDKPEPFPNARTDVVITQYPPPTGQFYAHDIAVDSMGNIWAADGSENSLEMLDPRTEQWLKYPYPVPKAGPHSIIEGPDGKIWVVLQLANTIVSFDPNTKRFQAFKDPGNGLMHIGPRPHTHQFDSKGNLWFTEIANNSVSKLDPRTGKFTRFTLPAQPDLFKDPFWLWPYGLAIDSKDNVYYSKLGGNRIGRIDAAGRIKEFTMPEEYSGPRRLDVDAQDRVWIPTFMTGKLYKFDPATEKFTSYPIPTPDSTPYALYVDKQRGQVWICESSASKMAVFDITAEKFSEVELPTPFGYSRKIDQDKKTGDIWSSYSQELHDYNYVVRIHVNR